VFDGGGADRFRIKIWDIVSSQIVDDNQRVDFSAIFARASFTAAL
jgi:hypothetical protein